MGNKIFLFAAFAIVLNSIFFSFFSVCYTEIFNDSGHLTRINKYPPIINVNGY